ncbi:MAG TPA: rhodanese-like domain-containing protein [Rhizomicrobium sp.]|nr:rhodanese-like domain-containing protein [Rhizomicrobium sp.]
MIRTVWTSLLLIAPLLLVAAEPAMAATEIIPASALIQPAQLAGELKAAPPTILQVGFSKLYQQAHIPGAIYAGPTNSEAGLAALKAEAEKLPRSSDVVIYCGCCPWNRCPNMDAAYTALKAMGFSRLRALYIANNFGQDWVDKGYPVATGQ